MNLTKLFRGLVVTLISTAAFGLPAHADPAADGTADNVAPQSWHLATTGGNGARARDCYHPYRVWPPSTSCSPGYLIPAWTNVRVVCQVRGQLVSGYYGTTDLWNYVVWEGTGIEGFAADANINTGYSYWIPGIDICQ